MADPQQLRDALRLAARVSGAPAERVFCDRTGQLRVEAGPDALTPAQREELDLLAEAVASLRGDPGDRSFPAYAGRLVTALDPALVSLADAAAGLATASRGSAAEDGHLGRYVERIEAGVTRLLDLVHGLEEYVMAGQPPRPEKVDPGAVLDELRPGLAAVEGPAGARLSVRAEQVLADRAGFRLLLRHLLDNALRYHRGPAATVTVRVGAGAGGSWTMTVADDGPGIPAGDRDRLLAPMERLDRDSALPGLGLGLATCTRVAAAHGGRLRLQERSGGGTAAWVRVPRRPVVAGG